MATTPYQPAQSRVFGVAELLEAILLAFAEPQRKQADQEPAVHLYPLLRVCKTWNRAITASPSLQFLMKEPRHTNSTRKDENSVMSMSQLFLGLGNKIERAWKKSRETGIAEGSWTQIRVIGSETKETVQLTWYARGADKKMKVKPGTTFGQLFDKMNTTCMFCEWMVYI